MLIDFFLHLKKRRIPVTITEYLALLEALSAGLANCSLDDFYSLSRICLVKNEAHYDRFDLAFAEYFEKIKVLDNEEKKLPEDWLKNAAKTLLTPDELAMLDVDPADKPYELSRMLSDEKEQIKDGSRMMMGGGGNSPLGMGSINPEGMHLEGTSTGNKKVLKAWDSRQFKGLDDEVELGTRNIKIALRRLRQFAREGVPDELDLEDTIKSTARNAGWLDLKMRPERKNKVKVLLLFDFGGSMSDHVKQCEALFSAASAEFKHMAHFYFHNCIYDTVWKYDGPSVLTHYPLHYLTNRFGKEYKLIIVGDATMGPTEITDAGGSYYPSNSSSQHSSETWMRSLLAHYKHAVWLNPEPQRFWSSTKSIQIIRDMMENRMYPLNLRGLDDAMRELSK